jgi:dihydroorotate dehydrogenase
LTGYSFSVIRSLLFRLDAEQAHKVTLQALKMGLGGKARSASPMLRQNLFGLEFPNPIGLAAGFDKNAEVPDEILKMGFGFAECGTVTPRGQPGNAKPRIFRLRRDRAVINRLGFNNDGLDVFSDRLAARANRSGIVGANLGANRDTEDKVADYVTCLKRAYPHANYFTINVSSPNTPGLRGLQNRKELHKLISQMTDARRELAGVNEPKPLLLKVAPDLNDGQVEEIIEICLELGVDGLIVANTTIERPERLRSSSRRELGGLSGAPLFRISTELLSEFYSLSKGKLPLVGVGGISSSGQAYGKIRAGASLVQLYTGLIYEGPDLIPAMQKDLVKFLKRDGFSSISEAVGANHRPIGSSDSQVASSPG